MCTENKIFFSFYQVDYMLWPWAERSGTLNHVLGEASLFSADQFPALRKWKKTMRENSACDQIYHTPEIFQKYIKEKLQGTIDYDNIYP